MTQTTKPTERVEALEAEVDALEQEMRLAQASIQEAEERLMEIGREQDELAHLVFSGDEEAESRFRELEEEERVANRSLRVPQSATTQIRERYGEVKERLFEARRDVHREQYAQLQAKAQEVAAKRDAVADELEDLLEQEIRIRNEMAQALRNFDPDVANAMVLSKPHREFVRIRFRRWLG